LLIHNENPNDALSFGSKGMSVWVIVLKGDEKNRQSRLRGGDEKRER